MRFRAASLVLLALLTAPRARAADWPQLQGNAARTGYTADSPAPPYRVRWMWLGPNQTLRNRAVNAAWPDDLTSRSGYNFPLPSSAPMTLATMAQPVVAGTRVFVGDQEGQAYAVNLDDGSTLWAAPIPGGTFSAAAVAGDVVVFTTLAGDVCGFDCATGVQRWRVRTGRSFTNAPLLLNGVIYVGNHGGEVRAIQPGGGTVLWTRKLDAAVQGELAGKGDRVYVGAEDMVFYAIHAMTGEIEDQATATGQSFRRLWPVVGADHAFVRTCMVPCVGSEYVAEDVCAAATSITDEQNRMLAFLSGTGGYQYASTDWKHMHVFSLSTLTEPYQVGDGPSEGCGAPAEPPVLDPQGRPIFYWKTKYPELTNTGMFGSNYAADLSRMDLATGRRIVIDNNRLSNVRMETDNMYALSLAGNRLFLRQRFRGTQMIDLTNSNGYYVSQQIRYRDGGGFDSHVYYDGTNDTTYSVPSTPERDASGRCPVVISGRYLFITEPYALVVLEPVN